MSGTEQNGHRGIGGGSIGEPSPVASESESAEAPGAGHNSTPSTPVPYPGARPETPPEGAPETPNPRSRPLEGGCGRSGREGRWFKSSHPDSQAPENTGITTDSDGSRTCGITATPLATPVGAALRRSIPKLVHHRASGQGRVRLWSAGKSRDVYCGPWGAPECEAEYRRVIADWLARGCALPESVHPCGSLTLRRLGEAYAAWATATYVKGGRPTKTVHRVRRAVERLLADGDRACMTPGEFGPKALTAFLVSLAASGAYTRRSANELAQVVVTMFRWAVAEELIEEGLWRRLEAAPRLRKGRPPKPGLEPPREGGKVQPVPDWVVWRTMRELSPPVAAMVYVQRQTGMRPCEVVAMGGGGVRERSRTTATANANGHVTTYTVPPHALKTAHLDVQRVVALGPRAAGAAARWLTVPHFGTTDAYRRAIQRAADRAGVPRWSPNQLRHARLSEVRERHGLDAAQAVGGHRHSDTTERYARVALRLAVGVAAEG